MIPLGKRGTAFSIGATVCRALVTGAIPTIRKIS
jgi:hypothetical protein